MELTTQLIAQHGLRALGSLKRIAVSLLAMIAVCALAPAALYAQPDRIQVKGKVVSQGEPVIGAGVLIKGTTTGAATDMDGNFVIDVAPDAVLVVSSVGFVDTGNDISQLTATN